MIDSIKKTYGYINERHPKKTKIVRYIISGGTAAAVDLVLLYILTDLIGIWYITSSILAYLVAFMVSFTLQKFWTFRDHSRNNIHSQAVIYFIVTSLNLGLNTLGIFAFVHYLSFHYLIAQIVVSVIIAMESYYVYHFIFNETSYNNPKS
ncbi:MAG: GtrA family protein [Candidatus Taylorbacteria bacterium]|nr:GtrA family protein [Candidatus Taylorbacteria bacterium]